MKHYFVIPRATWDQFPKENFEYSHWIPTDDPTKILLVVKFAHEAGHELWTGGQTVEPLPHVVLGPGPIQPTHAAILTGIGVKAGDKTVDVARKAAVVHPCFNPERD